MKEVALSLLLEKYSLPVHVRDAVFRYARRLKVDKKTSIEVSHPSVAVIIIASGVIRYFNINRNGDEDALQFLFSGQSTAPFCSPKAGSNSSATWISVIQPGVIYTLSVQDLLAIEAMPGGGSFLRQILEEMIARFIEIEKILRMPCNTARYYAAMELFDKNFKRLPQKEIASWIGTTAVSLSRLKREIKKEQSPALLTSFPFGERSEAQGRIL